MDNLTFLDSTTDTAPGGYRLAYVCSITGRGIYLVLWLRDVDYFANRDPVSRIVYYLMLEIFMLAPLFISGNRTNLQAFELQYLRLYLKPICRKRFCVLLFPPPPPAFLPRPGNITPRYVKLTARRSCAWTHLVILAKNITKSA